MRLKFFRDVFSNIIIVALLVIAFVFTYAGGVLNVFSHTKNVAIYHGNKQGSCASLMVNVYWGTEYIEPMLNLFEQKDVKATFFVGGVWANNNASLLNKILEQGHELGNHGYNHKDADKISEERNKSEIKQTHAIVKALTSVDMKLFAPPSGAFNQTTLDVASSLGYATIMWTLDTIDWRDKDSALIASRATKNLSAGNLILMHPTEKTLEALPQIISAYQGAQIRLRTVSECI